MMLVVADIARGDSRIVSNLIPKLELKNNLGESLSVYIHSASNDVCVCM